MNDIDPARLNALIEHAREVEHEAASDMRCDIEIGAGDWGGQIVGIALTQSAAIHLARQLLQLAAKTAPGAHFHVDKASIALNSDHQLVFTRHVKGPA